jgi:hypothetical protein
MAKIAGRSSKQFAALALGALTVLALSAAASPGPPGTVVVETVPKFSFMSGFTPQVLSGTKPTPVKLTLAGEFSPPATGGPPPVVRELLIETDRKLVLDTKGLPACNPTLQIESQAAGPGGIRERCKGALIGHGSAGIWTAFPESKQMQLHAELLLYNGGRKDGSTRLFAYAQVGPPLSGTLIAKIDVKKISDHHYGAKATVSIPKIAGGSGWLSSFEVTIGRNYGYKGQRHSVMSLECSDSGVFTEAEAIFADGTAANSVMARTCVRR